MYFMKTREVALKSKGYSGSRGAGPTGTLTALRDAISVVLTREGDGSSVHYVSKGRMDLPVHGRGGSEFCGQPRIDDS